MLTLLSEFKPDSASAMPLYMQLSNKLAAAIHDGTWQPDEALPSERSLSEHLCLSRVTARKAFDVLCERGLLNRKQGSGTFITPRLEQPLSRLSNFSDELRQRGFAPGSRWLSRESGIATPEEILALDLSPNTPVARLKRLRTADDVVMAIESSTLPSQYLPNPKLITDSLYDYLKLNDAAPRRALQHIRAVNATDAQAALIGIKTGAAMLFITRVGYHASGRAIELTHSYCRSEYYDFVAELFK
jgi:GntR family transcriptional regulator